MRDRDKQWLDDEELFGRSRWKLSARAVKPHLRGSAGSIEITSINS